MQATGVISFVTKAKEFSDASSLWEFQIDGASDPFTCRTFDSERGPVVGDTVLIFLMPGRNHATQVIFDADLRVTRKAIS